jgi:hypothetical protein
MRRLTLVPFVAGLLALYLGERVLAGIGQTVALAAAAMLLLCACGAGVWRWVRAQGDRRDAAATLLLHYLTAVAALVLYGATRYVEADPWHSVLWVSWPALLALGLVPLISMEAAAATEAPRLELWRVRLAGRGARIVVFAVIAFAGLNFASTKWNRKVDLSYFKQSRVGSANLALVASLDRHVQFTLFFPTGNEVLENVRPYFEELARASDQATLTIDDQALAIELARKLQITANGYVALTAGEKTEKIHIGLDVERARSTLRKLDGEVHKRLLQVLRPDRVVYLTTGHMERDFAPPKDDQRLPLIHFKKLLEVLGFSVKRLGMAEGLATQVPEDASVVVVADPRAQFADAEVETLTRYFEGGGRLMLFADADTTAAPRPLLAAVGVGMHLGVVATDVLHHRWRVQDWRETAYQIATNKFSSHTSIDRLSRERLTVALMGAAGLTQEARAGATVTFPLTAMQQSWLDDGNGVFDEGKETRESVSLMAAVESAKGRALVFGDTDVIGDGLVLNPGNQALLMDGVRWLAGDEDAIGDVESEEDVRLVHRRDEDRLWFYGTSLLMPASVLGFGTLFTRRRRRS